MSLRHHIGWHDGVARVLATIAIVGMGGCATSSREREPVHPEVAAEPNCQKEDAANRTMTTPADVALGCFNRANLRAMVADQRDLDHGQVLAPASGAQEARGVDAYKKGEVKKLAPTDVSESSTQTPPPETQ